MPDLADDIVRTLMIAVAFTLAMVCIRFGWVAVWQHDWPRSLAAVFIVLLLAAPAYRFADAFDEPLPLGFTIMFAAALTAGVALMATLYTVHPEWTRTRLAHERDEAAAVLEVERTVQDSLRADDRVSQSQERADARDMHDPHPDAAEVEFRDAQDANRQHSHDLQDEERATVRADEDDRL